MDNKQLYLRLQDKLGGLRWEQYQLEQKIEDLLDHIEEVREKVEEERL
jgi:hypothetical protein